MLLRRYHRYIARLLAWPMFAIALSLTSIVWLTQALRFVDFIINRGLSVGDFLSLALLLVPSLLLIVLPVAMFVAALYAYHRLRESSELVVFTAAGLSPWQLARPAFTVAFIATAICYATSLYLMPLTKRQFKDMQNFLRDNYASALLQEEVFNSPVDGLTVFIRSRAEDGTLRGILVHDNRAPGQATTMMAEEARLVQTPSGPQFYLVKGMRQERKNGRMSWLNFDSYNFDISLYAKTAAARARGADELSTSDLLLAAEGDAAKSAAYRAELHQRLTWPMYALGLAMLAAAAMLKGEFNRRGAWKRIAGVSALALALVLGYFGLVNLAVKIPALGPTLYPATGALLLAAIFFLRHDPRRRARGMGETMA